MQQRAVIYARVSTAEQAETLSLPTQIERCEEYCRRAGMEPVKQFVERGASAKTTDRVEFQLMLAWCRANARQVDAVVVYSVSRFARSLHDHVIVSALLRGLAIELHSVTEPVRGSESASDHLVEGMMALLADFDNRQRSERTRDGMLAAVKRGRWVWRAPLGYLNRAEGGIVPDPERAPLITAAYGQVAAGSSAQAALARASASGLRSLNGSPVPRQTWHRVITNPIYRGRIVVPEWGVDVAGEHEALVDEATWYLAQATLRGTDLASTNGRRDERPEFPLRRFVRCGCGRPLTASFSRGKAGARFGYYHCPRGCERLPVQQLEELFLARLEAIRPGAIVLDLVEAWIRERYASEHAGAARKRQAVDRRIVELDRRRERLVEAYVYQQAVDRETYERQGAQLREQVTLAELERAELRDLELDLDSSLAFARRLITDAALWWRRAPIATRRRLQGSIFPEGMVLRGGALFEPSLSPYFSLVCGASETAQPAWRPPRPGVGTPAVPTLIAWLRDLEGLRELIAEAA